MARRLRVPEIASEELRGFLSEKFEAYAQYVHGLRAAPFQRVWARAIADPSNRRLVIVAPPESGKTAWCIAYCAWLIGREPTVHIGYLGNTAAQALRQSVAVRDTVRSNPRFREMFPDVALDESKGTSEREWFVRRPDPGDKDATFIVSGFRGPILGARLDVAVLDDYSDQENTASPEQQDRAWEWLAQNVLTRLNPDKGRLICIQTRWAEGDVVGRLEGVGAQALDFPALTAEGAPLWPERWNAEALGKRRAEMGSRLFDLHYMGVLHPKDGQVFKADWWNVWDTAPDPLAGSMTLSVDTASKTGFSNDYSAATVWARREVGEYLMHAWRDKLEFPELLRAVESLARGWNVDRVLVEDAGSGQALVQELQRRGLPVIAIRPHADKVTRAIGVTAMVEAGRVYLPRLADWLDDFRYELETFPRARHDDWVDSFVQYLEWASEAGRWGVSVWF